MREGVKADLQTQAEIMRDQKIRNGGGKELGTEEGGNNLAEKRKSQRERELSEIQNWMGEILTETDPYAGTLKGGFEMDFRGLHR